MEKNFANIPTVSIGRSKFNIPFTHKTSFNLGDIVPLYIDEVLPGDTRSIDVSSLIRMSTPIAPIMDDIVMELFAFFIPNRLVWNNWKAFMGESDSAGAVSYSGETEKLIPSVQLINQNYNSIGSYMGLPYRSSTAASLKVSQLPLRCYAAVYNRWFRNQNVEGKMIIPLGDSGTVYDSDGTTAFTYASYCKKAYKKPDYFTSGLPYAQKGDPVSLPLGTYAPVITRDVNVDKKLWSFAGTKPTQSEINGQSERYYYMNLDTSMENASGLFGLMGDQVSNEQSHLTTFANPGSSNASAGLAPANLWANLENATAATVNDLRLAFAVQKLLEKDSLYGSRYWEVLYGHFGVRSPDASLQDPEYLGGMKFYINIDQVLQTTGFDTTAGSNTLGTPGANSVTGNKGALFTKSFCEHGHILIVGVARQKQHTYGQGLARMWSRSRRFDYYFPVFANLGSQEVRKKEIYAAGDDPEGVFSFQEAWAEYRFKHNIVSADLNPENDSGLDYWTLADNLQSMPTLGKTFLTEGRENLARALVTGSNGPDFIGDFLFMDTAVRPMPLYSVPGLIDHH